ncbi:16S rRNA (guanine(527)-N(7))-methyltransferase RsmG [Paracraurococcus lichenis]|uniref:Ribosomal RNA small subunit methyltransferase G n=1 Tax=Paracraurococcus lichenis TaxID=3064888 RepID=A0ABT9E7L0_9PROT|nr:16S rRNA (guanine(527)-N(7))-methyltransferase RsmG [Paracraurococcus sp. LOR1-02]MDO9712164.1 16S rRNA (guanine(527)-N(7))-methyltransferase RsmG [Paracraurococcus sp. LOR1-02]
MKHPDLEVLGVSRETGERLGDFVALLSRWNSRINLTAERDEAALWQRHILDSLQLGPLLPPGEDPIVDLGSGAGFPGLMLALVSGRETHLVESDRRKSAFLIEAARILGLPQVKVHPTRIDAAKLPPAAVVSARALAPLPDLLAHAHRILTPGGVALFPKGRTAEQELTDAARAWIMRVERFPSRTDPTATILRISEIRPDGAPA